MNQGHVVPSLITALVTNLHICGFACHSPLIRLEAPQKEKGTGTNIQCWFSAPVHTLQSLHHHSVRQRSSRWTSVTRSAGEKTGAQRG